MPRRRWGALAALAAATLGVLALAPAAGAQAVDPAPEASDQAPAPPAEPPAPVEVVAPEPAPQPEDVNAHSGTGDLGGSVTCEVITLRAGGFPDGPNRADYKVTLERSSTPLAQGTWSFEGSSTSTAFPWIAPPGRTTVKLKWQGDFNGRITPGYPHHWAVIATAHLDCEQPLPPPPAELPVDPAPRPTPPPVAPGPTSRPAPEPSAIPAPNPAPPAPTPAPSTPAAPASAESPSSNPIKQARPRTDCGYLRRVGAGRRWLVKFGCTRASEKARTGPRICRGPWDAEPRTQFRVRRASDGRWYGYRDRYFLVRGTPRLVSPGAFCGPRRVAAVG